MMFSGNDVVKESTFKVPAQVEEVLVVIQIEDYLVFIK